MPSHYAAKQFREMTSLADVAVLGQRLTDSILLLNRDQEGNKSEIAAINLILRNLRKVNGSNSTELFRLNASHCEIVERLIRTDQPSAEILKDAASVEAKLKLIFNDDVFVALIYKAKTLWFLMSGHKSVDHSSAISAAVKMARENLGDKNGLLCQLYLAQAIDFRDKKRFKDCLQLILEVDATFEGLITPAHFITFKTVNIDCLVLLGKLGEAEKIFILTDQKTIGQEDPALFFPRSELYESAVAVYQKKGNLANAIIYKESSLSALVQGLSFDNSLVQKKARELRQLLADNQKWSELRALEERFHLKPLPKQPGES